jgi:broad specificity phosphatase PhoE
MRIIAVRHYKTEGNLARQIIGWAESPPADGWQADLVEVMKSLRASDLRFQQVYTSDLKRAQDTGLYYAQSLGINEVVHAHALREINYGRMSGKNKDWVEKHIPLHKKDPDYVYPDGESFAQMQSRSVSYLRGLETKHANDTLLVVAHAGVIRGLISNFLGLDYHDNLKRRITHRYIGDFTFEGDSCVRYTEHGRKSGFIKDGVISTPLELKLPPKAG